MTLEEANEARATETLNQATAEALKEFNDAKAPCWDKCYKAQRRAWREYEKDIAPLEIICHTKIASASRAYSKATENRGNTT